MPLLRGARPVWKPGIVAGERRRPAASSICDIVSSLGPVADASTMTNAPVLTKAAVVVGPGAVRGACLLAWKAQAASGGQASDRGEPKSRPAIAERGRRSRSLAYARPATDYRREAFGGRPLDQRIDDP